MSSCTCGAKVGPAKISVPSFAYGDVAWKHHLDSAYTLDHSIPALALILQRRAAHSCALCVLSARACLYANWKLVCTIQEKKRGMREREREREREQYISWYELMSKLTTDLQFIYRGFTHRVESALIMWMRWVNNNNKVCRCKATMLRPRVL